MIAFSLTNIKDFMSHLLLNETFDHFSFIEGEITTFNTLTALSKKSSLTLTPSFPNTLIGKM